MLLTIIFILIGQVLGQGNTHSQRLQITQVTNEYVFSVRDGLFWDAGNGILYWADTLGSQMYKYNPATGDLTYAYVGNREVYIVIPVYGTNDKFLITSGPARALCTGNGISSLVSDITIIATVSDPYPEFSLNDGKISPGGVLVVGTKKRCQSRTPNTENHLYAYNGTLKILLSGIGLSNGLIWTPDEKYFYYVDSLSYEIACFDYDSKNIELSNRRVVFNLHDNGINAIPDGLTIDTDGNLWVACPSYGIVLNISPKGELLNSIRMPVYNTSDPAFGGINLTDLYITSGNYQLSEYDRKIYPLSGDLFKIEGTGAKGYPGTPAPEYFLNCGGCQEPPSRDGAPPCS